MDDDFVAPAEGGFDAGFQAAPLSDEFAGGAAAAQDSGAAADADFFGGGGAAAAGGDGNPFGEEPAGGANGAGGGEAAPEEAPMVFAEPEGEDPRIAWAKKNADLVAKKDKEEQVCKAEQLKKAQAFLKEQSDTRTALLSKRKAANREAERVSNVAQDSVPKGTTPWERVISVVNFNAEGISKDPHKELSRFKGCLLAAKKNNVPVAV